MRRQVTNFRVSAGGLEAVDALAAEEGVTRSDVLRAALSLAMDQKRALVAIIRGNRSRP